MHQMTIGEPANHWFAIQVWAGREHRAAEHLRARGYDIFLPRYLEHHRWSDRVKKVERALFTGYLFCRIQGDAFGTIVSSCGVLAIVGDGERPLPVDDDEIAAIQRIVDTRLLAEPWPFLVAGQRVRIEAGPLRGTDGIVVRLHNRQRLVVSVALLQRSVAVELDPSWVTVPTASLLGEPAA
jgi:transcription antitermination factor NusG